MIFGFYAGEGFSIHRGACETVGLAGDFHRPYENSEIFGRLRSSKYTPSVSRSLDSSLREGAGVGLHHSIGCSLSREISGDFHRPYGSYVLPFIGGQVNDCFCGGVWYNVGKNRKRVAYAGIY